jgi:hypothetical protein
LLGRAVLFISFLKTDMKNSFKRIIYSLLVVLLWLGFVVDGAHAFFIDSATLTGNTISTGTADLLISNSQNPSSTTYDDSRPGFILSLTPGETQEKYFLLKNASSAAIPFDVSVMATSITGNEAMLHAVSVEIIQVDETGLPVGEVMRAGLDGLLSTQSSKIGTIAKGATQRYKLRLTLDSAYKDQSQSMGYDLVFKGVQSLPN